MIPRRPLRSLAATATLLATTTLTFAAPTTPPTNYTPLTPDQLDTLTAPIALYPDPLLAQVLPACTEPLQIVTASQWLRTNSSPTDSQIAAQPWQPFVQALVRYPAVLNQLANDIASTQRLGQAYLHQTADVMAAIQRLRQQARSAGSLLNSPQQSVIVNHNYIEILPRTPDVIYVPIYDPACYVRPIRCHYHPPCRTGPWLDRHPDWNHHPKPTPTQPPPQPTTPTPDPEQPTPPTPPVVLNPTRLPGTNYEPNPRFPRNPQNTFRPISQPNPAPIAQPAPTPIAQPSPIPIPAPTPNPISAPWSAPSAPAVSAPPPQPQPAPTPVPPATPGRTPWSGRSQ